ncbi:verprolin-like protein [Niveomyces insectorum RCEF 264]|uniref:Verprolin-like protein n=1 Tax=Niveomyces insectorum RCEF 264 TaxID=1081102 RepID=A0A167M0Y7_9HYPO|nr:verprolin-like protein [Niveomyces insectorum RCEF 264]
MADQGHSSSAYHGVLPPLQDRRGDYRYLNTILEESDSRDASPINPPQLAASMKLHLQRQQLERQLEQQQKQQRQQQQQQQHLEQQLRLHEERQREDRRREDREQKIEMWLSPMSDHFPTPRGFHFLSAPIVPSSPSSEASVDDFDGTDIDDDECSPDSNSFSNNSWNNRSSDMTEATEMDDIYEASDDDNDDDEKDTRKHQTQRAASAGVKRHSSTSRRSTPQRTTTSRGSPRLSSSSEESRRMLPQLVIPTRAAVVAALADPDPKLCTSPMAPTPSAQVPMSPAIMSFMQKHHALEVPTVSAPPSLDGSMTSEQMSQMSAQISAPPTPIIGCSDDDEGATTNNGGWSGVQLQPGALATLQTLARSDAGSVVDGNMEPERVIEVPDDADTPPAEAMEMSESSAQTPLLRLVTSGLPRHTLPFSPAQQRSLAGLTRLEIPSPGGFFSGLSPRTRHTWNNIPGMTPIESAQPPTSGAAERFYRFPWSDAAPAPPVPSVPERSLHMPNADMSNSPVEQVIEVAPAVESEEPVTAYRVQKTPVTAQLQAPAAEDVPIVLDLEAAATTATTMACKQADAAEPAEAAEASSPVEEVVATEIVNDYLALDAQKMQQVALSHLDRTEMWLVAQRAYLNGIADLTEAPEDPIPADAECATEPPPAVPPKDKQPQVSTTTTTTSTAVVARKKTVRFSEAVKSPAMPRSLPSKLLHPESAYYRAFTDCMVRAHASDVFVNRLPRFEALQAQRLLLRATHRNQLLGKYQLAVLPQSAKKRLSANVVRGDDNLVDDPAKLRADKEADALSQMALATWHVAALKLLNGGRLIAAPVHKRLARLSRLGVPGPNGVSMPDRARILDLGGQATCDWAWHAALQYPNAKVYSVTTKAIRQLSNANVRGPSNHRQVAVEKLTKLPFDDAQFDLVRAAELYSILKFVGEHGEDEWATCLRECFRVLKPGGYLEFSVLDSELVNAGPLGNAKSVEFGFVLQTLGYDPSPTKLFLGRLASAGFADVRRAWVCLPVGPKPAALTKPAVVRDATGAAIPTVALDAMVHGTTDHVAAVTGLAGSWSWERWLLRAEMEKTAGELRRCARRARASTACTPSWRRAGRRVPRGACCGGTHGSRGPTWGRST